MNSLARTGRDSGELDLPRDRAGLVRHLARLTAEIGADRSRDGAFASFLSGLVVTLGNPKVMVFYLAITPTIIDIAAVTASDYGMLIVITAMVLLVVLIPYLMLAARARWFLATPRALRLLNRAAATFLVGAAAAIALRQ